MSPPGGLLLRYLFGASGGATESTASLDPDAGGPSCDAELFGAAEGGSVFDPDGGGGAADSLAATGDERGMSDVGLEGPGVGDGCACGCACEGDG